jgi:hypothetical protein
MNHSQSQDLAHYLDAEKVLAPPGQATAQEQRLARGLLFYYHACCSGNDEVCQELGKALGYPWFKDDQVNFPGATEDDGVCVGEHVAASLAVEAAERLRKAQVYLTIAAHNYRPHWDRPDVCSHCGEPITNPMHFSVNIEAGAKARCLALSPKPKTHSC